MGEVVRFVSRSERERTRLIREARAIYDSIFPPTDLVGSGPLTISDASAHKAPS
jgi:hypothetical protein